MIDRGEVAAGDVPRSSNHESFERLGEEIVHRLQVGALSLESIATCLLEAESDPKGDWWRAYLRGVKPRSLNGQLRTLRVVDLFAGPGGLMNGVRQLCAELGASLLPELVVDLDEEATLVHAANHGARQRFSESVARLVDFSVRRRGRDATFLYSPELVDEALAASIGGIDLVLAGPPCQGHSSLNNHTRGADPRNGLYLTVPAFAVATSAPICIIENVPAVLNDSESVVEVAISLFESAGYEVQTGLLSLASLGWPQNRKRHFLVARRGASPLSLQHVSELLADDLQRSVWWAIGDLEDIQSNSILDRSTELSPENASRVDWLFENDEFNLALPERPSSHRSGTTYVSVYGRLRKEEPSQTITTGFMSPGRGRYVHPTRRRTLTPHEAARLQGFPDSYNFSPNPKVAPSRSKLAKWIGDAVPMPLGYAAAISAFGAGWP